LNDRDALWVWVCLGVLSVTQLLQSLRIAHLQRDVEFALIVSRETEAPSHD